jgi:hypothetical protein
MRNLLVTLFIFFVTTSYISAQDSAWVRLRPKYNEVGRVHRALFGENYRQEWSDSTYVQVIDIADVDGGLKPLRLGGGHQTVSLRLVSPSGKEWVLRNIEKDASVLLPEPIRQTFARDVVDDAMSAQHPFSPLVVAVIAEAVNVPHAVPIIGLVKESPALGEFNKQFANKVCLLEEREPYGESENTARVFRDLDIDNDNGIDGEAFLKARLLDVLIGDWDRHADQWRWIDTKKGKNKLYVGIPRDRDQAFYVNQGLFPRLASRPWFVPSLQGFRGEIWFPKYALKESNFIHSRAAAHMPYEKWMEITRSFVAQLTDDIFERALKQLPARTYARRHDELLTALKKRRDNIPQAMHEYYHFINRLAEMQLSDKHEFVHLYQKDTDTIHLDVYKISKQQVGSRIFSNVYYPGTTKEFNIYMRSGNDSVLIDLPRSKSRVRIIGGVGEKKVNTVASGRPIHYYASKSGSMLYGNTGRVKMHVSDDSAHTRYSVPNRYDVVKPLVTAGFNRDDGFLLGIGLQYMHPGFRKTPYASLNRIMLHHSFATSAYRLRYSGEFIHAIGKADVVTQADIYAPENTQNFFGRGNESIFIKGQNRITFYRTRFSLFNLNAGLRWRSTTGLSLVVSPSFQHYRYDEDDNRGRILELSGMVNSYDSSSIKESKTHGGLVVQLGLNKRNDRIIPNRGYYFNIKVQAMGALNDAAKNYGQLLPEFVGYVPLNSKRTVVFAERIGGGVTVGKPAFYQSVFVGGHENLLGYRQYRFSGDHMLYNNMELRIKLANFAGYIIPGEFGTLGFYDVGRVWLKNENSNKWHHGVGGGLYFAPAKLAVVSLVAGYSNEGWYPYITFGFRY